MNYIEDALKSIANEAEDQINTLLDDKDLIIEKLESELQAALNEIQHLNKETQDFNSQ